MMTNRNQKSLMKNLVLFVFALVTTFSYAQKKWTLQECVTHALENNISVRQSENNILVNEQDVIGAKGNFLPSLSANFGGNVNIGFGVNQNTGLAVANNTRYSANYGLDLSQNVFNGFRTLNLYKQSLITKETTELDLQRIKDDISLNVANSYLNVLFNKERLETAKAQYEFSKKQLDQVNELVDAGVQPRANVYDAEATLSNDEQSVTIAENNYTLSLLSISQLLQVPFNGFEVEIVDVGLPSVELMYDDITPILNYAFENRNEIKVANKNIENAKIGTEISKSGYFPSVSFRYGFGSSFAESNIDFTKTSFFKELDDLKAHNFGLNVNIPIFSRFQNKTAVAKSKIQEENRKLDLEQAKLNLESTVQRAFTDAQAALKAYVAANKSLESQQLAFSNSQERYNIGAMNAFDLEQARVRLINAESSLINAKYDFVFKTKILDFYLGKTIQL